MTADDRQTLMRAAMAEVRACAAQIADSAGNLLQALPKVPMDDGLRATAIELSAGLNDTAGRVTFELALLQAQLGECKADAQAVVRTLSTMDATMMGALATVADLVERLEKAAEREASNERAFVLVIEATGVMLQGLENAKVATEALCAATPP
jgi:hypothetical protein